MTQNVRMIYKALTQNLCFLGDHRRSRNKREDLAPSPTSEPLLCHAISVLPFPIQSSFTFKARCTALIRTLLRATQRPQPRFASLCYEQQRLQHSSLVPIASHAHRLLHLSVDIALRSARRHSSNRRKQKTGHTRRIFEERPRMNLLHRRLNAT